MKRFNYLPIGLLIGLILPALFIWAYIVRFYPSDDSAWEILKKLYPSVVLGKLLMLSIVPDLAVVFIFYKQDSFRIAGGVMMGAILYLISSIVIMN